VPSHAHRAELGGIVAEGSGAVSWPAQAIEAPVALRLVSAGAEEALERFSDPALLDGGKVNVISLEAIEARLGARWELRRDQVYDFATRVLARGVGDSGFFVRVSPTDFFIVHPDLGRVAGQAACLRYLREVLNHFLGDAAMASAGVLQVTKIAKGRLEARQMDQRAEVHAESDLEIEAAPAPRAAVAPSIAEDAAPAAVAATPDKESAGDRLDRWTPFVAADGRQLRVTASLEPVYELKGFTRIGFRMIRRVIVIGTGEELSQQQVAMLSTADLLRVDLATIVRGIDRLAAETSGERQLSLIVPLSFTSLSSQKGRTEFAKQLKEAGGLVKLGVICEICDIDGVPPSALLAATSLVRPFTLLLAGRVLNTAPAAIVRLEGSGLQAVSFECPPGLGDAEFIGWAVSAIGASKRVAKSVMVYQARTPKQAGTLASLGASHASIVGG
jgi:hypothetical protein